MLISCASAINCRSAQLSYTAWSCTQRQNVACSLNRILCGADKVVKSPRNIAVLGRRKNANLATNQRSRKKTQYSLESAKSANYNLYACPDATYYIARIGG